MVGSRSVDHRLQLALLGVLPAVAAMFYFDWLDRRRPEPVWRMRMVVLAGMLSTLPVLAVEFWLGHFGPAPGTVDEALYGSYVVAAAPEELAKLCVILLVVWRHPAFDERLDGIVYAAHAGLGFALVENVGYLFGSENLEAYWATFVARALLAVPGHAIWAGMMGYFAARRRFDRRGPGILGGFVVAWFLHGSYDAALSCMPLVSDELTVLLALIPVGIIVIGFFALRRMARIALAADDHAEAWGRILAGRSASGAE
jgi:RsiW-degrading membrane proteinase PrsW (M82 family)